MELSQQVCSHCGISYRWTPILEVESSHNEQLNFCCRGCQGAYNLIKNAGLGSFYCRPDRATPTVSEKGGGHYNADELAKFITPDGNFCRIDILIGGISCPSCIWLLERIIPTCNGVKEVSISYAGGVASVRFDPAMAEPHEIFSIITSLGYSPRPYSHSLSQENSQREKQDLLIRFGTALFLVMQLMAYSYSLYAGYFQGISPKMKDFMQYVSLFVSTPVVFYSGAPFLSGAWKSIVARRPGMDLLIAIGALSAWTYSVWGTFAGQETYFESAAMIITFVLAGRLLESSVKQKAMSGIESLYAAVPQRAIRLKNGIQNEIAVDELKPGDMIVVRQGDKFPVDCIVVAGTTEIDQSLVTGESIPVTITSGAEIRAGSVNTLNPVEAETLRAVGQSYLMRVAALVQMAQSGKPSLQRFADRVAGWFVPAVILLSMVVFAGYMIDGYPFVTGVMNGLAVLLIACPCAVGLAVPTAILAACSRSASLGIIVRGGDVVERLASIRHAFFDKTGTITIGMPEVIGVDIFQERKKNEILYAVATLEQKSSHPVALSLLRYAADEGVLPSECKEVNILPGRGIYATISDKIVVACGSRTFMEEQGVEIPEFITECDEEFTQIWVAFDFRVVARFMLCDKIRPGVHELVREFNQHSISMQIISGDGESVVKRIGAEVGINLSAGTLLPHEKLQFITNLQKEKKGVLMVGDGVNDAPSLAAADVSCTLTGSSDIALENSDIIIIGDDLSRLATAHRIARKTMTIIKQNLAWACVYNLIGIPLAILGMLTPLYASVAMVASSLLVSLNSLRLMRMK